MFDDDEDDAVSDHAAKAAWGRFKKDPLKETDRALLDAYFSQI